MSLRTLTHVSLEGSNGITTRSLQLILASCPNLVLLDVNGCNKLGWIHSSSLPLSLVTSLKTLRVSGCNLSAPIATGPSLPLASSSVNDTKSISSALEEKGASVPTTTASPPPPPLQLTVPLMSNLSSSLACIFQLVSLTELDLSAVRMHELPISVSSLSQLRILLLRGNSLSHLPLSIGHLRDLHTLDVAGNRLIDLPTELGSCVSLTSLACRANRLTSLPSSFGSCIALRSLDLSFNSLVSLPSTFTQLQSLRQCDLQYNHLEVKNLPLPKQLRSPGLSPSEETEANAEAVARGSHVSADEAFIMTAATQAAAHGVVVGLGMEYERLEEKLNAYLYDDTTPTVASISGKNTNTNNTHSTTTTHAATATTTSPTDLNEHIGIVWLSFNTPH
jgi:hypothetical protein